MNKLSKIMQALEDAKNGDISRVYIEGQTWVRVDRPAAEGILPVKAAGYTFDPDAGAYYFWPAGRTDPPYKTQVTVEAIIDIAHDGTLAGVELLHAFPPPPEKGSA